MTGARDAVSPLHALASAAGLLPYWTDAFGARHQVEDDTLRQMLMKLGLPCETPSQAAESRRQLESEARRLTVGMVIVDVNEAAVVPHSGSLSYELILEDGSRRSGTATPAASGMAHIPALEQPGYHTLRIGDAELLLAVCPFRCPSISDLTGKRSTRAWGIAAQVYSLRSGASSRDKGALLSVPIHRLPPGGGYSSIAKLAAQAGAAGASALAISPVHAMFSAAPQRYSPYSPSSRLFLNAAYIDPAGMLGEDALRPALLDAGLSEPYRDDPGHGHSDWPRLAAERLGLLRRVYDDFCSRASKKQASAYKVFRQQGGEALETHALFEALHASQTAVLGPENGWMDWPENLRDPSLPVVKEYAAQHAHEVGFHVFLQWMAARGMQAAQSSARAAGMPIGLIADLAIGTDARGSHAWSRQNEMLAGVSVGAPPDLYQPLGQNWGLTAFSPRALRLGAYHAFIETLRASLNYAGGVRIDHILGLRRMWLIADGASAADGVYLRYPFEDMLRLVALESWRHKAVVVGENLGTVPDGFNAKLKEKGIMGMSVLWFERDARPGEATPAFRPPSSWSSAAMATPATHDLPTLAGWWVGRDLYWQARAGQIASDETAREARRQRDADRRALWRALRLAGCVGDDSDSEPPEQVPRDAILAFIASTPSPLLIVSLEDLLALKEQPNLPGTPSMGHGSGHPNWRQLLPMGVEDIFKCEEVLRGVRAIVQARGWP